MYNKKTIDYFSNPRNMGEISDADIVAKGGNPACGDVVQLWVQLDGGKISDIKFKAFGCGACIASSSALTELVMGKTTEEAQKITNKDIAKYLGGLPAQKMVCSNFSAEILRDALQKHKKWDHGLIFTLNILLSTFDYLLVASFSKEAGGD